MDEDLPPWQDLEEESLRPVPEVERTRLRIRWSEWPGPLVRSVGLRGMTDEALDWLVRGVVEELGTRAEGKLKAARLLARLTGGPEDGDRRVDRLG